MPFVSIEGIDGSGKSTQARRLSAALDAAGKKVILTKEPDGGRLGLEVRAILTKQRSLSRVEELLLVSASRYDHVRSVIRPALKDGNWVVSDRFLDSTFAFQAYGSDRLSRLFDAVSSIVVDGTFPDFTFILDLPADEALARRINRSGLVPDPSEGGRDFQTIRAGLLEASRLWPRRCHLIDATESEDEVAASLWRLLQPAL